MNTLPFSDATIEWFTGEYGEPTPVQEASWPEIAAGRDTLVSAPTGTGKTLSAFLVFIDRLSALARRGELENELYLIYISPLKSLAGDIRENLRKPLLGVARRESLAGGQGATAHDGAATHECATAAAQGNAMLEGAAAVKYSEVAGGTTAHDGVATHEGAASISVGIRTGDTSASDRRAMFKNPPHILITTPESLYILLTSLSGARMLRTAKAIIIDELHAMIGTKRGAHLTLSMARLDALHGEPLQRIGLSATIEPLDVAARYLSPGGARIVAPKSPKAVELIVKSPMPESGVLPGGTIWPEIAREVYAVCQGTRCVIAFVESRMHAEKLAYQVNLIAGEGFALAHHGSVSKERRALAEQALREGRLRLLCATSSMELGIDVGEIDLVVQIGCPRTVSGTLQRLGRAGHNPGRVSAMRMFPRTPVEGMACGITAELARNGVIEPATPPRACLDVLAQHLVSMSAAGEYSIDDVLAVTARAYPFRDIGAAQIEGVLCMLAGDFEHGRDVPARPRLLYDRINGRVRGDAYSRLLALSAGGTIPDRGLFAVRGENGVRYGEVDEEFVFEARVGDRFLLGAFAWKILSIGHDDVVVAQCGAEGVQPPFWKGEVGGRSMYTGLAYGKLLRELSDAAIAVAEEAGAEAETEAGAWAESWGSGVDARIGDVEVHSGNVDARIDDVDARGGAPDLLDKALYRLGLDPVAADGAKGVIMRQVAVTGMLPDDRTIIVEHFQNEVAENQLLVHSVFGRKINTPLALLARESASHILGVDVGVYDDDDGFLLFPVGGKTTPDGLLYAIEPATVRRLLDALLPMTPLFSMAFRYNAARALMMGVRKSGRQPLWIQRQRSAKLLDGCINDEGHPLVEETKRECIEDYWDVPGLEFVLNSIRSGAIVVREVHSFRPSPMSLPLRRAVEMDLMYDYTPTAPSVRDVSRWAVVAAISSGKVVMPGREQLEDVAQRGRKLSDEHQLHALLMTEGDQLAGEADAPLEWFEGLASRGRAEYIEPGLWIAAEHAAEYALAYEGVYPAGGTDGVVSGIDGVVSGIGGAASGASVAARRHIVRRALRYHGGHTRSQLSDRYAWPDAVAAAVLDALVAGGEAIPDGGVYYHSDLYELARRKTVLARRELVKTQPRERYAALLAGRVGNEAGLLADKVLSVLRDMRGQPFPLALWETVLLPGRIPGYRPEALDAALSRGEIFWKIEADQTLAFYSYDDADWDNTVYCGHPDMSEIAGAPEGDEIIILDALNKRGALFIQGITAALDGKSPYDALLSLAGKGLVRSDSFVAVRQILDRDKLKKAVVRQRAHARAQLLTSGRWELARGIVGPPVEKQLSQAFDTAVVLCRETVAPGLLWSKALETLRVWEYSGRARRGYYVEGMSGAQFVREEDFAYVTAALARTDRPIAWLPAQDPAQPWGKSLPHLPGRAFMNLPGAVVCLIGGLPALIFERQGQILRILGGLPEAVAPPGLNTPRESAISPNGDTQGEVIGAPEADMLAEALKIFVSGYHRRRFFNARSTLTVKQYPAEATTAMLNAGFTRYMQDLALYRK